MALSQWPAPPDAAGEVGWSRGMKAGPGEGTWEQHPVWKGRDGTRHILKKEWEGLGDGLDVGTDDIYPGRTKYLFALVKFGGITTQE